jgi:hypothetical protein
MNLTDNQLKELLQKKNVISVKMGNKITAGIDTGVEAIIVGVETKVSLTRLRKVDVILASINNIPTDVQVVKKIKALAKAVALDRTKEYIPAPGGVSVGHPDISAGTLGMWVKRKGIWGILSNNHVLGNVNRGKIGDLIYQPGPADGGTAKNAKARLKVLPIIDLVGPSECPIANTLVNVLNTVARLFGRRTRLATTVAAGLNLVDCGWAEALDDKFVDPEILEIGLPKGECEFEVDERIKKSGRSSDLTYGTVTSVDAAINVDMGDGQIGMFSDQIEFGTPGFIVPGDSGSAILSMDDKVGGLGFAGNEDASYANKYRHNKSALELDTI